MTSNYQDEDIQAAWNDVFSSDKYRTLISCIAENFPAKKSVKVDYADITASSIDFSMFVLEEPDRCLEIARNVASYRRSAARGIWSMSGSTTFRAMRRSIYAI